jgi:hypothetical protein
MVMMMAQQLQLVRDRERRRACRVRSQWGLVAFVVIALGLGVGAAPAFARLAAISGRLSKPGYSVIALAYNGRLTVSRPGQSFSLTPPGSPVALQLRGPNGKYAGPVVIGHSGKWLVVGVKAGAKLGTVAIKHGYATVRKLRPKFVDSSRVCQQRDGVPLGNGLNFGYVRSSLTGEPGPGNDPDLTCVPGAFNVASNGKKILNDEYRTGTSRASDLGPLDQATAAQATPSSGACLPTPPPPSAQCAPTTSVFSLFSQLFENLEYSVNVDAGSSYSDVDSYLQDYTTNQAAPGPMLQFEVVPGGTAYLDCGGLSYCTAGGTGHEFSAPNSGVAPIGSNVFIGPAFPSCCTPNANGWGQITSTIGPGTFSLFPLAPVSQIGTGDVYLEHLVSSTGAETTYTADLNLVFETTPALDTLSDGAGDSYTVSYPVTSSEPGVYDLGHGIPFQVTASPSGDVLLTLTFWRPQRPGIASVGEPAFMDMGHLTYSNFLYPVSSSGQGQQAPCHQDAYSTSDPNLAPTTSGTAGMVDQAADSPPNPANTLTYSLDLTRCLAENGLTANSDGIYNVDLQAADQADDTSTVQFAVQIK